MNKMLKRFHSDVIVYDRLSFSVALNLIKNVFRLLFYLLRIGISMTLASPFSSPIVRTIPHGGNGGSIPPSRTPLAPLSRALLLDCGFPGVLLSILHPDSNPLLLLHSWTWLPFCLFPPIKNGPCGPFYWWKRWESNPRPRMYPGDFLRAQLIV